MIFKCPRCGARVDTVFATDERLDENGYPKLDTEWELDDGRHPAAKLIVRFVYPNERLGREIRGTIMYRTRKNGTEYDLNNSAPYSTSYEVFQKTWNYKGPPKDYSGMKYG